MAHSTALPQSQPSQTDQRSAGGQWAVGRRGVPLPPRASSTGPFIHQPAARLPIVCRRDQQSSVGLHEPMLDFCLPRTDTLTPLSKPPPKPPLPPPCTSVLLQGAWCASLYSTRQCLHHLLFPPLLPSYLPLILHLSLYPYPTIHHVLPIAKFTPSIRHMPPLLYTRGPKPRP